MSKLKVQGSPSYYECEVNILDRLETLLKRYKFESGLIIHGEKSWEVTESYFPKFKDISILFERYNGECSETEILRLSKKYKDMNFQFIIGIGGGKISDLSKAVANELNKDVILIPTLASTCAPWTPLSVIYNDKGEFVKHSIFPRSNLMLLVEPRILLNSPLRYLRAGIGDTLAKFYECQALTKNLESPRLTVELALKTADVIKDILLGDSKQALNDLNNNYLSSELLRVFEANIAAGGLVGGLGDEYGRVAAAHSVHNALTRFKETHNLLHGEKVAFGILVQLSLENNFSEIKKLIPFFKSIELPCSLSDLGLNIQENCVLETISKATLLPDESIHFMNSQFSEKDIIDAILNLENFIKKI